MAEIFLTIPISEKQVREINSGDVVYLSGVIYTARDAAHKYLIEKEDPKSLPFSLEGGVVYHCGPIVKKINENYEIVAAGPTTSIREEPYEADVINKYGIRAIIGKGGMGEKSLQALEQFGAVYLSAIGGAAIVAAKAIKRVKNVYMLKEFGIPEAFWELEIENFQTICTMDSKGKSLHQEIEEKSKENLKNII